MELYEMQRAYPHIKMEFNQPLANYSYTKTGGPADVIAFPKKQVEVEQILIWTREHDIPVTVLGNLSNLIVQDGGIRGVVLILTDLNEITVKDNVLSAMSGSKLIDASQVACDYALTGLEFACGIPGSMGGAIYMNAGAYGGEMKDIPLKVTAMSREGHVKEYDNAGCQFSYRHSVFQENGDVILKIELLLQPGQQSEIQAQMDHLTYLRMSKQPLEYPSCGSVFKRPEGHFTGKLIQDAGLQGYRIGGAEISKKHAGFIINVGGATATDYTDMISFIQETIWDKYQVRLDPEVRVIGEKP